MAARAAKERIKDARQALYQEHILDAAEQIFAEHGYEDAKVVSMASAAGVSLATVYRAFETKWDIYRAVHARRTAALLTDVQARMLEAEGTLERMLAGISGYIGFHMRHPNYLRMHLRDGLAWALPGPLQSKEQRDAWSEGFSGMIRAIEAGVKEGLYIDDDPPELLARTMIAMHQVRLSMWIDGGMKDSVDQVLDAVYRQFLRTFGTPKAAATSRRRGRTSRGRS